METQRCSGACGLVLPADSFDLTRAGKLKGKCRNCLREEQRVRMADWRSKKRPDDWRPKHVKVSCQGDKHSCNECQEVKDHSEFYADATSSCGFASKCKSCRSEARKSRWANNTGGHRDKDRERMSDPERRKKKSEYHFKYRLQKLFNITREQWWWLLFQQDMCCALCADPETRVHHMNDDIMRLAIDHDHRCCPDSGKSCGECIRGLLCTDCNLLMGKIEKKPLLMSRFANYIDRRPLKDYDENEPLKYKWSRYVQNVARQRGMITR